MKKYKHLYYGEGKGKTTAAIGLAIRAAGAGMKVIFAQFMKGSESSEIKILKETPNILVVRNTKEFGFYKNMSESDIYSITQMHNDTLKKIIQKIRDKECNFVVLDEITSAYGWKLLGEEFLVELLNSADETEVIMTGRNPDSFLRDRADYITEMKKIRHPYDMGVTARKGIEN